MGSCYRFGVRAGCAAFLAMLVIVTVLVVGIPWLARGILGEPDLGPVLSTAADAASAERKLSVLVPGRKPRDGSGAGRQTIALSEAEVNAFLAKHLPDLAGAPLGAIRLRLREDRMVELAARTSLRAPLGELAGSDTADLLPSRWLEQPLWLRLDGAARLEQVGDGGRRYLRLDVERFRLGRRRVPAFFLRLFLDPTTLGLLRWPLPPTVEGLEVERGRVVIRTTSSR